AAPRRFAAPVIASSSSPEGPAPPRTDAWQVAGWHAAWLVVLGVAAVTMWWWRLDTWRAVAVLAAPALAGALAARGQAFPLRALLLFLWAMAAAAATFLAGGISGPLAAWTLTPLAAASLYGERRSLALGGALSAVSAGFAALVQLSGL